MSDIIEPDHVTPELTDEQITALPEEVKAALTSLFDDYSNAINEDEEKAALKAAMIEIGKTFMEGYQLGLRDGLASAEANKKFILPNRAMRRRRYR